MAVSSLVSFQETTNPRLAASPFSETSFVTALVETDKTKFLAASFFTGKPPAPEGAVSERVSPSAFHVLAADAGIKRGLEPIFRERDKRARKGASEEEDSEISTKEALVAFVRSQPLDMKPFVAKKRETKLQRTLIVLSPNAAFVVVKEALLGKGAQKIVYKLEGLFDPIVKAGYKVAHDRLKLINEIQILERLKGTKGLVQLFEKITYTNTRGTATDWVLLDYYPLGDLSRALKPGGVALTLEDKSSIARGLIEALKRVHDQKIIHADLKLANIFLGEDREAVIADFGVGLSESQRALVQKSRGTLVNYSPEYAAEVLKDPTKAKFGEITSYPLDIYALGVVLYQLYSGKSNPTWLKASRPVSNMREFIAEIANPELQAAKEAVIRREVPPFIQPLILAMISFDPKKRTWDKILPLCREAWPEAEGVVSV